MPQKKTRNLMSLLLLAAFMAVVFSCSMGVSYVAVVREIHKTLTDQLSEKIRLIDTFAFFDTSDPHHVSLPPRDLILSEIANAHADLKGNEAISEFVVAERTSQGTLRALTRSHRIPLDGLSKSFFAPDGPVARAADGQKGSLELDDGEEGGVIVAYAPMVSIHAVALVIYPKSAVRTPFVVAAFWAVGLSALVLLVTVLLWLRTTSPLVVERRSAEGRHRALLDAVLDGILTLDVTGQVSFANAQAEKMFGAPAASLEGRPIQSLLPELKKLPPLPEQIQGAGNTQSVVAFSGRQHLVGHKTSGQKFPVLVGISVAQIDDQPQIFIAVNDLTEQNEAEENRQRLAAVVEQSHEGIVITDPNGTIQYVNPAFSKSTGYLPSEVIGQTPRLLKSGKHAPSFYDVLWKTILAGQVFCAPFRNKTKDGRIIEEDTTITPVFGTNGEITNFVAIKQDVTKQRAIERHLNEMQHLESIGQLAGGVAHDFNNLLSVIKIFSDLILQDAPAGSETSENITEVLGAVDRAAKLTSQLLAFSRRSPTEPTRLDLNEVVDGIQKMLRGLVGETVELVTVLEPQLDMIFADPAQIEQVIVNLIVNARDAMPKGGRVVVRTRNVEVTTKNSSSLGALLPGAYVTLEVEDDGEGMKPSVLKRIFEPFFTTKEIGHGTGLGLSTCFGIVKQAEGELKVQSALGQGTTFTVWLPVAAEPDQEIEQAEEVDAKMRGGTETIMVVDDDEKVRSVTVKALKRLGYHVLHASNGDAALVLMDQIVAKIDLVVTDVVMPKVGGIELRDALQVNAPQIKVILMSGYPTTDMNVDLGSLSRMKLLHKPFSTEALAKRVRQVLDAD